MTAPASIFDQIPWEKAGYRILRWIIFSVLTSLVPIAAVFIVSRTMSYQITLTEALSKGALLLISVSISGAAIGELIGNDALGSRILKLVLTGLTVLNVTLSALWFGSIATLLAAHQSVDANAVTVGSLIVFISSVILGIVCVGISSSEVS